MAKPKLALIPSGYKDGKVYSVLPSNGDGDFTFSRGSNATRVNKDGLIEEVDANTPRLDYTDSSCPSLLLEPQRTNLITYSEDFSQWTNDRVTVSESQIISPNGTLNTDLIAENSENNIHRIYTGSITLTDNVDYTITVFAKKGNSKVIQLTPTSTSAIGSGRANFDLENGVLGVVSGGTAEIKDYGNGWYRCSYSFEALATATSAISVNLVNDDLNALRNATYAGNINNNVYLWGAQLEAGSYPTSYIPTNGASATRLAETATGAGDASTFNSSEGVLMAELSRFENDTNYCVISLSDGSTANRVDFSFRNTPNLVWAECYSNSVPVVNMQFTTQNISSFTKLSIKYKQNDFSFWINGFKVGQATVGNTPISLSELSFDDGNGAYNFYGNTKQIQYYDTVLTDLELETLTSYRSWLSMVKELNLNVIYNG